MPCLCFLLITPLTFFACAIHPPFFCLHTYFLPLLATTLSPFFCLPKRKEQRKGQSIFLPAGPKDSFGAGRDAELFFSQ
jgi:hypothetical protein